MLVAPNTGEKMFDFKPSTRPDRCELCRHAITESRVQPLSPGAVMNYEDYFRQGAYTQTHEVLVCKRMPPIPNERGVGVSPEVISGDWCGEFDTKVNP
jgi:hypothetical protein